MRLIFGLINLVLDAYKLLVIVHIIVKLVNIPANRWTTLLDSIVEPVLNPVRTLVAKLLPKNWQFIDWSPVALLIIITIIQWIL